jgi:hypothetical protein
MERALKYMLAYFIEIILKESIKENKKNYRASQWAFLQSLVPIGLVVSEKIFLDNTLY